MGMLPVLFKLGTIPISSFGVFLSIAFLVAVFTIWRIARIYEIDPEKILDLVLLTFFGGLILARIYHILLNLEQFDSIYKMILINRYPGLSFWGGLLGGFLTLYYFIRRSVTLRFWQVADFAAVAFLLGCAIADIGCFLGGCVYGRVSSLPFTTDVVGLVGRRLPVSLFEAVLLFFAYLSLRKMVLKFHFPGKVVSFALIYLGIIKLGLEFLRGDTRIFTANITFGHVLSALSILLGVAFYYQLSKKDLRADLIYLGGVLVSARRREEVLSKLKRGWYNYRVDLKVSLHKLFKGTNLNFNRFRRRINVKPTPDNAE